jgi:hypothetical protein
VAKQFEPSHAVYGGNVRSAVKVQALAISILSSIAGLWLSACKSAPELTQAQAQAMIQAKYDQDPGFAYNISVDDRGMQQGVSAKYWAGIRRYPNGYWGDFKLTDDGKKVLKLPNGGDTIQWRPDGPNDPRYIVVVVPLALSHLKARNLGEIENLGDSRTVPYLEDVNLAGMPDALQNIAHNAVNKLVTERHATFVLTDGAWTLKSVD